MSVSTLVVRGLLEAIETEGVSRERFLCESGFDGRRLEDAEGRITLAEYDALHELALDLTGNESFGLRMAEMASVPTYSVMANLVAHSATLREGFDALVRFHRLMVDRPVWRLVEREDTATLLYDVAPGSLRSRRLRSEIAMVGFYRIVLYFGRTARPRCVAFEHSVPEYRSEYTRIFEGAERFDQSFTGIVLDRETLGAATLNRDPEFHAAMEVQAEKRISRIARNTTYAERVREQLIRRGTTARADMGAIARALGLSVRSLRRRLSDEGVAYHAIAAEAQATLAKELLSDEGRSIQETAYAMGFSDPSAFYRAFKRWTGTTPKSYRSYPPTP